MHLHAFIFQSSSNAFNQSIHILRLNIKASIPTCLLAVIPSTVRLRTHSPRIHSQAFSSSAFWQSKQGGKQDTKRNIAQAITTSEAAGNDPYDFTTLEENIANVTQRLRDELVKIRVGGRVGVESVGELRVSLKGPGGGSEAGPRVDKHKGRGKNGVGDKQGGRDETLRLEELAQVMQRGRTLILMVGEEEVSSLHLCCLVRVGTVGPLGGTVFDPRGIRGLDVPVQFLQYLDALICDYCCSISNPSAALSSPRNTRSIPPRPLTTLSNYISPSRHQQPTRESRHWKQRRNVVNQLAMPYDRREAGSRRGSEPCSWRKRHCPMM